MSSVNSVGLVNQCNAITGLRKAIEGVTAKNVIQTLQSSSETILVSRSDRLTERCVVRWFGETSLAFEKMQVMRCEVT